MTTVRSGYGVIIPVRENGVGPRPGSTAFPVRFAVGHRGQLRVPVGVSDGAGRQVDFLHPLRPE